MIAACVSALLLLLPGLALSQEENSRPQWTRSLTLDPDGIVNLFWKPDHDEITFEIQARTRGYAALGFSSDGQMTGADIIAGWVRPDGVAVIQDLYATTHAHPEIDEQQSHEFLWASENETHTIFRFRRKYDTCDKKDFRITNDTVYLLYAYHSQDPTALRLDYHGLNKGSRSVHLLDPPIPDLTLTPEIATWDVRQPKIKVPRNKTTYWCKIIKLAPMSNKRQLIAYKPIIDNAAAVHHIFMYECSITSSVLVYERFLNDEGHECYTATMPSEYSHCSTILAAWGIGSQGSTMPSNIGIPLGEEYGGATYFMLEVHYENKLNDEVVDSSGLRLYSTSILRPNEASVMNIGHVVSPLQIIPPNLNNYVTVGHCNEECTRELIPPTGITIYDVFPQGHFLAKSFKLRHIRNGMELPPIIDEKNYDPYLLQSRRLNNPVKVLPGDHILAECGYNSSAQSKTVVGGLGLNQEMCLVFLHYYPRILLSECQSWPAINLLTSWFNIKLGQQMNDFIVETSAQNQSQTLVEFLEQFNWGDRNAIYEEEIRYGAFMPFCLSAGRFPAKITNTLVKYPTITMPYYEIQAECTVNTSVKEKETISWESPGLIPSRPDTEPPPIVNIVTTDAKNLYRVNGETVGMTSETTVPRRTSVLYEETEINNSGYRNSYVAMDLWISLSFVLWQFMRTL